MAMFLFCLSYASVLSQQVELVKQVQIILDEAVAGTPYAIQMGMVSEEHGLDFGVASGKHNSSGKAVDPLTDTFLFGSGTKPFTASAIMKLVENGTIRLSDKASKFVDLILAKNGTSLAELFGRRASNITVDHLVSMQSGLADFDVPAIDIPVLEDGTFFPPEAFLRAASNCSTPMSCDPGACTMYSSINFILLGYILVAQHNSANPADQKTWETYNQRAICLSSGNNSKFEHTSFLTAGRMSDGGLTVSGSSAVAYHHKVDRVVSIYNQSASILGWSCGNIAAPAIEIARFYDSLLGSSSTILSKTTVVEMMDFHTLSKGWEMGKIDYGKGLMIEACTHTIPHHGPVNASELSDLGVYLGHGGATYGFLSEQGFYASINSTIAVVTNQDLNTSIVGLVHCKIVQTAARMLYSNSTIDLRCGNHTNPTPAPPVGPTPAPVPTPPVPTPAPKKHMYKCTNVGTEKKCLRDIYGSMTHSACKMACK
jgi:CubicO group peptidase (beta-lactamase class C family)